MKKNDGKERRVGEKRDRDDDGEKSDSSALEEKGWGWRRRSRKTEKEERLQGRSGMKQIVWVLGVLAAEVGGEGATGCASVDGEKWAIARGGGKEGTSYLPRARFGIMWACVSIFALPRLCLQSFQGESIALSLSDGTVAPLAEPRGVRKKRERTGGPRENRPVSAVDWLDWPVDSEDWWLG